MAGVKIKRRERAQDQMWGLKHLPKAVFKYGEDVILRSYHNMLNCCYI